MLGVLKLELTGGEATLHPEIDSVVKAAKERHFWVLIKSHGVLSEARVSRLIDAGLDELTVSLYGNRLVHDAFTGVKGSWDSTIRTIDYALQRGVQVSISLILHSGNYDHILELQRDIVQLGTEVKIGTNLHDRHRDGELEDSLRLTSQQWAEFYRRVYAAGMLSHLDTSCDITKGFACACARDSFAVASNGSVYPCIGVPWEAGSIYESTLGDIWANSAVFHDIRQLKPEDYKQCDGCELRKYCDRAAPNAFMASGSYTGHDPLQCEQALAHKNYVVSATND